MSGVGNTAERKIETPACLELIFPWGSQFSSVTQLCLNLCDPLAVGLQHARLPCPSPTPRACSNSQVSKTNSQVYNGPEWINNKVLLNSTGFPGSPVVKNLPAKQEIWVRFLGQEDPPEKEMATQYSCLGNPMDRGAWRATVHGVAKSWT